MRGLGILALVGVSWAFVSPVAAHIGDGATALGNGPDMLPHAMINEEVAQQTPAPVAPPTEAPAPEDAAPTDPEDVLPNLEDPALQEEFSVGEIPAVEVVELTAQTARGAVDAYVLVRDKYKDAALENYENLQDFVDQNPLGKQFEADIKALGFANVNEWNIAITTVGFAYSNIVDDQTADIKAQIEEVRADTEMAQDMRDRMVAALNAMIPSENNHKVVTELLADPLYGEKLKLLENEEE